MRHADLTAFDMVIAETGIKGDAAQTARMMGLARNAGLAESSRLWVAWSKVFVKPGLDERPMPGLPWRRQDIVVRNLPITLTPQRVIEYDYAIGRAIQRFGRPFGR